jgi:DNA-binding LacI/PurR family transcriptional regulator
LNIDDIAKELNISKASVSRAITGNGRISQATRKRVLDYMASTNFHPNVIAQSLATLKTSNIAYIVPLGKTFTEMPFFMKCLGGVSRMGAKCSYDVVIVDNKTDQVQRIIANRKVDGLILSRNLQDVSMLAYLIESSVPFVLVGTTDVPGVIQVDNDNRSACREMAAVLIDRWKLKPGLMIGEQEFIVNQNRAKGFLEAVLAHDARLSDATVMWNTEDEQTMLEAFGRMYENGVRAFFCGDDLICSHLMNSLRTGTLGESAGLGHSVSAEDIKVASFYNSKSLETFYPDIPVIDQDAEELGSQACATLLQLMSGDKVPEKTMLEYKFKFGNDSG